MNETKCPGCGADIAEGGTWACGVCGTRGIVRQNGRREAVEDDHARLCRAQAALVRAMAGSDDTGFIEGAADSYARLYALHLNGDRWHMVGDGDGNVGPSDWLLAEHVGKLDEMVEAAEAVAG